MQSKFTVAAVQRHGRAYGNTSAWKFKFIHMLRSMETQNKLTSFTICLKSSLLGQKRSNWTSASCRESHSTSRGGEKLKRRMGSGPVRQAVKGCRGAGWFKGTTILRAGRQAAEKQERWFCGLSSSSSSGLLRLPLHHLLELKHTCTLTVLRSCSKYDCCIPMFCKHRETTSCHIFTSLSCLSFPFQPIFLCSALSLFLGLPLAPLWLSEATERSDPASVQSSLSASMSVSPAAAPVPHDWLKNPSEERTGEKRWEGEERERGRGNDRGEAGRGVFIGKYQS